MRKILKCSIDFYRTSPDVAFKEIHLMGQIENPPPVQLIVVAFSRHEAAFEWLREKTQELWGPIAMTSEPFLFQETDYYQKSMGAELQKPFFVFERLIDPADIIEIKRKTNQLEELYQQESDHTEERPLNLDPGYLNLGKFILASTKDHAHRLYLGNGIFAEVTLHYSKKKWLTRPWTFPDYHREDYHEFLCECRDYYKQQIQGER